MSKRKLTDKQVKAIWELFAKRVESPTEIRKRLNLPVSHSVVRRILEGQTYKHLKPGPEELTTGDFLLALFGRGWVTAGMLRAYPTFRYRHVCELQQFGIRLWNQNLVSQMSHAEEKALCWKISPKGMKYLRSGLGNLTKDLQLKLDDAQRDVVGVAERLGGEIRGEVKATGGYFGVLDLAEEVARRFKVPAGGGRATDPEWTDKRLINLRPATLEKLERLAVLIPIIFRLGPMQLAALLLEKVVKDIDVNSQKSSLMRIIAGFEPKEDAKCTDRVEAPPAQQVAGLKCSDIVVNDIQEFAGVELLPPVVTVKSDADYLGGRIAPPMYVLFSCVDELDVVTFGTYGIPRVWEAIGLKTLVGNIYKVCNMGQKFDGLYEVLEATPMKNGVKLKMRRVKDDDGNVPR